MFVVVIMSMLSIQSVYANQRFADVPSSHGASEEINYLVDLGVIKGYNENDKTSFKPNASVTRGQAAKMVIEATGNKPVTVTKSSFSDVSVGTELSGYVESAVKLGIFTTNSNGKFGPNVPLTRYEMSKVLALAFKLDIDQNSKLTLPFTDVQATDNYYKYISTIYYNGITKGDATGTKYNAKEAVKRSQFASFVARAKSETYRLDLPVQGVSVPDSTDAIATVKATTDNLNVRTSASSTSSDNILEKVNTGTAFPVYEVRSDGWLKVSYSGRYAYVYKDYVQFVDDEGNTMGSVVKQVKAFGDIAVYTTRDVNGKVVGNVNADTTLPIYKTVGNWYLTLVDGLPGYIRISQTVDINVTPEPTPLPTPTEKPSTGNQVVQEQVIEKAESQAPSEPEVIQPEIQPELEPEQQPEQSVQLMTDTIGSATVNNLHIRAEASGSSAPLGKISRGTLVEVHSISGSWVHISYNGIDGYLNKTYVRLLNQSGAAVAGRIIVLDPGHGGKDPGAISSNAVEKAIVLKVSNLVKQKLEQDGAIVKMTRTGDTFPTLAERVQYTKSMNGEIFISIHANAATNKSAKGAETYYSVTANDNEKEDLSLATYINNQIVNNADMDNRKVKRADYVVLRGLVVPAVLVELGFVTNSEDRAKLTDDKYIEIYAQSIYNGIVQYYTK